MSPYAGGRIEEFAQLRIEDVFQKSGHWVLRLCNLDESQKLKNNSSFRLIPIHEELIRCGFLAYVAEQKLAGHSRVFPSLKNENEYSRWAIAVGKWYSRYLDSIGFDDRRVTHHSFRYNFAQQLAGLGVEEQTRTALMGHWMQSDKFKSTSTYLANSTGQYPLESLVLAINALEYPEVDLTHLYVDEPLRNTEVIASGRP
jgi:integrase